jgi:hypothetical protein
MFTLRNGDAGRGHRHHGVERLAVERLRHRRAARRDAAHDLRDVARLVDRVARVDALGREREEEVLAHGHAAGGEAGQDQLVGRARVRRRLEDHELALVQVAGNLVGGGDDVRDVRILRLVERRRHADVDRVGLLEDGEVGGRQEAAGAHRGRDVGRGHVADMRAALPEPGDFRLVDVDSVHGESGTGEFDRQREAHVAEADHRQPCLALLELQIQRHDTPGGRDKSRARPGRSRTPTSAL